jgi:hypothetical protein
MKKRPCVSPALDHPPASAPGPIPRPGATELLIRLPLSPERMRRCHPTQVTIGQVHPSTVWRGSLSWGFYRCLWCQENAMSHRKLSAVLTCFHEPCALPPARVQGGT